MSLPVGDSVCSVKGHLKTRIINRYGPGWRQGRGTHATYYCGRCGLPWWGEL